MLKGSFTMKPGTVARRRAERKEAKRQRRADLVLRMSIAADVRGPDSIYAEMLAELPIPKCITTQ
jgi:hypothetical protein